MSGWLRCLIGLHDWDQFGECRRNWKHVQGLYDPLVWHIYGGPWSRVAHRRYLDKMRKGEALQRQMAALGSEVTLELCKDVASRDPELATAMLAIAAERRGHD